MVRTLPEDVKDDALFEAIVDPFKGKVVLVDFWATWCGPCKMAMKMMKPMKEELIDKDIVYVFIAGEEFLRRQSDLFGVGADVMYFDVNDTYLIRLQGYSPVAYNTYSVRNYNGEDLFVHALHDTVPEITKEEYRNSNEVACRRGSHAEAPSGPFSFS